MRVASNERINKNPKRSLFVKYGWKGIFLKLAFRPKGLLDPCWCKKIRCNRAMRLIINGRRK